MEDLQLELKNSLGEIKSQVTTAAADSKEAVTKLENEIKSLTERLDKSEKEGVSEEFIQNMQKQLDTISVNLKSSAMKHKTVTTMYDDVTSKFAEKSFQEQVAELKTNRSISVSMEVKAPVTITLGSYAGTSLTTEIDRTISAAPNRMPLFRDIVNVATIRGNKVTWVNKEANEGGAGMTAEGAAKSQMSWNYTEESADVKKITAYVKVSKESLDDLDFLRSEINTDLREAVELKLDEQISSGTGVGQNLKGILTYAPTFSVTGTSFATAVFNANRLDVLRTAVALVRKNRFNANYIVISPMDAALMDLEKGTDGHYIMPPFVTADGARIAGVRVIENEAIAEGNFLVGDFTKSNLRIREEININLGYENDDFTKNLVTILAEMRAVHYIKKHHVPAFVKGVFATAITAINQVEGV